MKRLTLTILFLASIAIAQLAIKVDVNVEKERADKINSTLDQVNFFRALGLVGTNTAPLDIPGYIQPIVDQAITRKLESDQRSAAVKIQDLFLAATPDAQKQAVQILKDNPTVEVNGAPKLINGGLKLNKPK